MNEATGEDSEGELRNESMARKRALKAEFERVALPQRSYLYKVASYLTKKTGKSRGSCPRNVSPVPFAFLINMSQEPIARLG